MRKVCPSCDGYGYHDAPNAALPCGLCNGQGLVRGDLEWKRIEPWSPFERFVIHAAAVIALFLIVMVYITWS